MKFETEVLEMYATVVKQQSQMLDEAMQVHGIKGLCEIRGVVYNLVRTLHQGYRDGKLFASYFQNLISARDWVKIHIILTRKIETTSDVHEMLDHVYSVKITEYSDSLRPEGY